MRLREESIGYILDLQKNMLPLIYCCANNERLEILKNTIVNYNGRIAYKNDNLNKGLELINTLLVFCDEIDLDNVLDIEKALIAKNKNEIVLLEANGIDSIINKRNLALSIINRCNIDVIKGTKSEVEALIKFQGNNEGDKYQRDIYYKFRNFSKKNNTIIIIEDDNYYITDGYSEFVIKRNRFDFYDNENIDTIYTAMIAVSIGVCKNKSEIVQAILITTIAFYISGEYGLNKFMNHNNIDKGKGLIDYILNEINDIDTDRVKSYGDIYYSFKR